MDCRRCASYMKLKHEGQTRKQGTPYYEHPLRVGNMLKEKGYDNNYLVAGYFHDLLEDTNATEEEILELSNKQVLEAVKLVSKTKGYIMEEYISGIRNNDIAKLVKLADRIDNIRDSLNNHTSIEFRTKYEKETKEWYLDLAKDTVFEDELNEVYNLLKGSI